MGLFEKIFGKREPPAAMKAQHTFQLLDGYVPAFHTWNGSVFESDLIRAALDAHGRHAAKLKPNIQGSAKPTLKSRLDIQPNEFQTWSQFLYRTAVILYARNTAFIVPVRGAYGEAEGVIGILPDRWETVEDSGMDLGSRIRRILRGRKLEREWQLRLRGVPVPGSHGLRNSSRRAVRSLLHAV